MTKTEPKDFVVLGGPQTLMPLSVSVPAELRHCDVIVIELDRAPGHIFRFCKMPWWRLGKPLLTVWVPDWYSESERVTLVRRYIAGA